MTLTPERLREVLSYDPATGLFTWRVSLTKSVRVGAIAGTGTSWGYIQIRIDRKFYRAHRLAWLYMTGHWPQLQVDHRNCEGTDNTWANLRECEGRVNQENRRKAARTNKSGFLGVCRKYGGWFAQLQVSGRKLNLGVFSTPEAAHSAYLAAKRIHHEGCTL